MTYDPVGDIFHAGKKVKRADFVALEELATISLICDDSNQPSEAVLLRENYGKGSRRERAAYGLAGLVEGLGILSLKQLDIMARLIEALQDREGSLFALS